MTITVDGVEYHYNRHGVVWTQRPDKVLFPNGGWAVMDLLSYADREKVYERVRQERGVRLPTCKCCY